MGINHYPHTPWGFMVVLQSAGILILANLGAGLRARPFKISFS